MCVCEFHKPSLFTISHLDDSKKKREKCDSIYIKSGLLFFSELPLENGSRRRTQTSLGRRVGGAEGRQLHVHLTHTTFLDDASKWWKKEDEQKEEEEEEEEKEEEQEEELKEEEEEEQEEEPKEEEEEQEEEEEEEKEEKKEAHMIRLVLLDTACGRNPRSVEERRRGWSIKRWLNFSRAIRVTLPERQRNRADNDKQKGP